MSKSLCFKTAVALCALGLTGAGALAQPVNDLCGGAIVVPVPGPDYVQVVDASAATEDLDVTCNSGTVSRFGIWHTFTPAGVDHYVLISENPSSLDTFRAVFTGDCNNLTQVACSDPESLIFTATAGTTYYVLTGMWGTTTLATTYTVGISSNPINPLTNDDCSSAISVAVPGPSYTQIVSVAGAASDNDVTCNTSAATSTLTGIWHQVNVAAGNNYLLTISEGGSDDTIRAVFTGSCGSLTQVACLDSETLNYLAAGGQSYYVLTGQWSDTTAGTTYAVGITAALAVPPANDDCATAAVVPIPGPAYSQTVNVSGANPDVDSGCNIPAATSTLTGIWHQINVAAGSNYSLTLAETGSDDTVRTLFSGTCGSLTQIACADAESLNFLVAGGQTYYLLTGQYSNVTIGTNYTVNISGVVAIPPANDNCVSAITVAVPGPSYSQTINVAGAASDADVTCNAAAASSTLSGIWHQINVAAGSDYLLTLAETGTDDTVRALFSGSCGSLTQINCLDAETMNFIVPGGQTYYLLTGQASATASGTNYTVTITGTAVVPPSNDTCSTATAVSFPGPAFSDTVNAIAASPDADVTCNSTTATSLLAGVWHSITLPAGSNFTLTLGETNTSEDTIRALFRGSCGSLTQILCTDTETGVTQTVAGGQTYYLLTGQYSATLTPTSPYTITISAVEVLSACCTASSCTVISRADCISAGGVWHGPANVTCSAPDSSANVCQPSPSNDACSGATVVSGPFPESFITSFPAAAYDDVDVTCNTSTAVNTRMGVWYSFTTGADAGVFNYSETGSNDVVVGVFTGACASLTQVACNDGEANINISMNANTTYYFLVGLYSATLTPTSGYTFTANSFTAVTGACCTGTSCSIATGSGCVGGVFLGANTTCDPIPPAFDPANALIPDATEPANVLGTLTRTVNTTGSGTISTLGVRLNISHIFIGDIQARLTGPNGVTVFLFGRLGGASSGPCPDDFEIANGNDIGGIYYFRDTAPAGFLATAATTTPLPAGDYRAEECNGTLVSLNSAFGGIPMAGTWTLTVTDHDSAITGTVTDWGVIINDVINGPCDNTGSCCVGATCSLVANAGACSGTFTAGGACSPTTCGSGGNVICCRGTTCTVVTAANCTVPATPIVGASQSAAAACGVTNSIANGCCFADFTKSSGVNIDDIFVYLNAWFASSPYTDIGGNGSSLPNIDDIFVFLNAWFAGCPS